MSSGCICIYVREDIQHVLSVNVWIPYDCISGEYFSGGWEDRERLQLNYKVNAVMDVAGSGFAQWLEVWVSPVAKTFKEASTG